VKVNPTSPLVHRYNLNHLTTLVDYIEFVNSQSAFNLKTSVTGKQSGVAQGWQHCVSVSVTSSQSASQSWISAQKPQPPTMKR